MKSQHNLLLSAGPLAAALNCLGQPIITQPPTDQTPYIGGDATISVTATSTSPLSYQWRYNGADLPGESNRDLSLANVQFTNAGPYSVVVSNEDGAVASEVAWLSVLPANVVNLGDLELSFGERANLAALNSAMDEDACSLSTDGLTLYFDSTRADGLGGWDIWSATRPHAATPWSVPVNLGSQINSPNVDGNPRISADGLSLYFDSDRPEGVGRHDIWVATRQRTGDSFSTPLNFPPPVNSTWDDGHPSLSADGLVLVLASGRPGGSGGLGDLWMTTRTNRDAAWDEPANLVELNSPSTELYPTLSPDGLLLFFLSSRTSEPNGNVWVSKRLSRSLRFGQPVHVDSIATTAQRARPHALSSDGTTLYYSSFDRPGGLGGWDLWQISVTSLPQLRALGMSGTGEFQFELLGREGAYYEFQVSTDAQTWAPWLTTNAPGSLTLSDPEPAPNGRRFYGVRSH